MNSSSGQLIFLSSFSCLLLCVITQHWVYSSSLPFYFPILWALLVTILSTWISCIVFKHIIKADSSITLHPISIYLRNKFNAYLQSRLVINKKYLIKKNSQKTINDNNKLTTINSPNNNKESPEKDKKIVHEIDSKYIQIWYQNISDDNQFSQEAKDLISKLSLGLNTRIEAVEKIQLVDKLAGVLIVHLKEYRRFVTAIFYCKSYILLSYFPFFHKGHYDELRKDSLPILKRHTIIHILVHEVQLHWNIH